MNCVKFIFALRTQVIEKFAQNIGCSRYYRRGLVGGLVERELYTTHWFSSRVGVELFTRRVSTSLLNSRHHC